MAELPRDTVELMFLGLDHGIDSIRDGGGPLIPFTITETNGERTLNRFVAELLEEGLAAAIASARRTPSGSKVVLVYDGFLTLNGQRTDAIYAEVLDGGLVTVVAQRYKPKQFLGKFETIGNPAMLPGPGRL